MTRNLNDNFWYRSALCLNNDANVRFGERNTAEHFANTTFLVPQRKWCL
jgi:hypothetical protein